jgi:uncharacterized repeat protein (TIGR02543 family)
MKRLDGSLHAAMILVSASAALFCVSCGAPLEVGADIKGFVDDGTSTVSLAGFTASLDGAENVVLPSGKRAVVTLDLVNPRSVRIDCAVRCADDSLLDSLPAVSVPNPQRVSFAFTPSLLAERKDLTFTIEISSPDLDRSFPPETITIHCNTPPGDVESSLDAALDSSGQAFAAFRLPSTPTDDDLAQVRISYAPVDGTGPAGTVTLPVADACLCAEICSVQGKNLLGTVTPLNRYFRPNGIATGDNYLFTVVTIDGEGLESAASEISSDATLYSVTYDGNNNTAGSAPIDPRTYRHTKSVTVLGQGTLERSGFTFAGWNGAADGSGTAYAPLSVFKMGPGDMTLYAKWVQNNGADVTFVLNPTYKSITFTPTTVSVARGSSLTLTSAVSGASNWNWYKDNVPVAGQTTSTFTWNTTGVQPGQYIISVDALFDGYSCTGSIRVTVTY